MRTLNLDQLKKGTPGITEAVGAYLAQATSFFLEFRIFFLFFMNPRKEIVAVSPTNINC